MSEKEEQANKEEQKLRSEGADGQPMIEPDEPEKQKEKEKHDSGMDLTDPTDKEDAAGRVPPE